MDLALAHTRWRAHAVHAQRSTPSAGARDALLVPYIQLIWWGIRRTIRVEHLGDESDFRRLVRILLTGLQRESEGASLPHGFLRAEDDRLPHHDIVLRRGAGDARWRVVLQAPKVTHQPLPARRTHCGRKWKATTDRLPHDAALFARKFFSRSIDLGRSRFLNVYHGTVLAKTIFACTLRCADRRDRGREVQSSLFVVEQ